MMGSNYQSFYGLLFFVAVLGILFFRLRKYTYVSERNQKIGTHIREIERGQRPKIFYLSFTESRIWQQIIRRISYYYICVQMNQTGSFARAAHKYIRAFSSILVSIVSISLLAVVSVYFVFCSLISPIFGVFIR